MKLLANTAAFAVALLAGSVVAAPFGQTAGSHEVVRRDHDEDYANLEHCPGGSIGDADACTFQPITGYDTPLTRWRQYGDWFDACDSSGKITQTVTDSVSVGNTVATGTKLEVGIDVTPLKAGVSASWDESWSSERRVTQQQSIEVKPGQAGNTYLSNAFLVAEGRTKVQYGSPQGGQYFWYTATEDQFTPDPSFGDAFLANVKECPAERPDPTFWSYYLEEYDAVKAGPSKTYVYDE